MGTIKELRREKKLTQQAAEALGISLRSYKSYEIDSSATPNISHDSAFYMIIR